MPSALTGEKALCSVFHFFKMKANMRQNCKGTWPRQRKTVLWVKTKKIVVCVFYLCMCVGMFNFKAGVSSRKNIFILTTYLMHTCRIENIILNKNKSIIETKLDKICQCTTHTRRIKVERKETRVESWNGNWASMCSERQFSLNGMGYGDTMLRNRIPTYPIEAHEKKIQY